MKKLLILAIILFSINAFAAPVNINTADAKTIADSLHGIGLKKAEAIIEYRTKNGAFKSVEDLSQVSGIGDKTIEKNKTDILLDDTSTPASSGSSKQIPPTSAPDAVTKTVEKKKQK